MHIRPVDVDRLRASPDADDEELRWLVRSRDLAVHDPCRIEDVVAGSRGQLLTPPRPIFDGHGATQDVDVGVAISMVMPTARQSGVRLDPADPAIRVVEEL